MDERSTALLRFAAITPSAGESAGILTTLPVHGWSWAADGDAEDVADVMRVRSVWLGVTEISTRPGTDNVVTAASGCHGPVRALAIIEKASHFCRHIAMCLIM